MSTSSISLMTSELSRQSSSSKQLKVKNIITQLPKKRNKIDFLDPRTRKVHFNKLKYNLDDLFNHTPVFDVPLLEYTDK